MNFTAAQAIFNSFPTTNDNAERGVALIQECTKIGRFKNEYQFQFTLEVLENNCKQYLRVKKSLFKNF